MNSEEIDALLIGTPSDPDSEQSDSDCQIENGPENDFDINNMEIIFDPLPDVLNEDSDWEEEDNLPLSEIRKILQKDKYVWSKESTQCNIPMHFTEEYGPNIPDNVESPVDIFLELFPEHLIEHICFQTNLYATQKSLNTMSAFRHTTVAEIKMFLAINMLMGVKKMPSYKDFWSSLPSLRDAYISSLMSRDRFSWLLSNVHLNDNSVMPKTGAKDYDKLFKIRPLLDVLGKTFIECYKPGEYQSVDESMIKFKGRSSIKQYMPMKPIKRGYKIWVRADQSGYVCQFQLYTGKVLDITEKSLGARVIKDLTATLVGKFHQVYFDNYFNSVSLQRELLGLGIYACGTARKGRKHTPTDLTSDREMTRGSSDWRVSQDGIVYLKWIDKRPVHFLSNFHNPEELTHVNRKQKDGSMQQISCPTLVMDYNRHMGYVDKADMMKSLYEIDRKSTKWYHRILWHFVDLSVYNSFVIFSKRNPEKSMNLKDFRISIIHGLVGANDNNISSVTKTKHNQFRSNVPLEIRFDKALHTPIHCTSRRCHQCSSSGVTRRTRWMCNTCNVGLCLTTQHNCFLPFHAK